MPAITLQLGQCGNQLGYSFFSALATELSANDYGWDAATEYFRPSPDPAIFTARSVLIDMEPKVVNGARLSAESGGSWWRYAPRGHLCHQSGSGNNWSQGFHGYGPEVREGAMELVRREAEQCDSLTGFLLLQSMAGGTGAGLGTYVAQALRDDFHAAVITNCCVWPYESGEVIVQPYNTLLTLGHLADLSDGIVLLENEGLHRLATKLMGIARPTFGDMNGIAARALAAMLLPSQPRRAVGSLPGAGGAPGGGGHTGRGSPGGGGPGAGAGGVSLPALRRSSSAGGRASGDGAGQGPYGTPPGGTTSSGASGPCAPSSSSSSAPLCTAPLAQLASSLCAHPAYRMLTLRAVPQLPPASIDFTTFTWPAILKRLRQMMVTGSILEEGMDWSVTPHSPQGGHAVGSASPTPSPASRINRTVSSWLVLRGQGAGEVDVSDFCDPALHAPWAVDPVAVSHHPHRFGRCTMAAALLANDKRCVNPIRRMQEKAYGMLASRAFVHQYEKYGMGVSDFQECFARIEDIVERYDRL